MHLRKVLLRLWKFQQYVEIEKGDFDKKKIIFLGHLIRNRHVSMDSKKVQIIIDWSVPTKKYELQSFLVLANFYIYC